MLMSVLLVRYISDVDECATGQADCGAGFECVNSVGSYKCIAQCPRGFEFLEGRCQGEYRNE